jgi:protein-disulfide isomerase
VEQDYFPSWYNKYSMLKIPKKQFIVAGVFLVLVGSLALVVIKLGNSSVQQRIAAANNMTLHVPIAVANNAASPVSGKAITPYQAEVQLLQQRWPDIYQHAVAPPRGSIDASYTIVEFGDFQCPQCGSIRPLVEKFLDSSRGKVNLIFEHCPFPDIHKWALPAAVAADVAADYQKFWPMYDMLYSHQDDLEPSNYGEYAVRIGIDKAAFMSALYQYKYRARVAEASQFAEAIGINITPTLLFHDNTTGAITIASGRPQINKMLANPPWASRKGKSVSH